MKKYVLTGFSEFTQQQLTGLLRNIRGGIPTLTLQDVIDPTAAIPTFRDGWTSMNEQDFWPKIPRMKAMNYYVAHIQKPWHQEL